MPQSLPLAQLAEIIAPERRASRHAAAFQAVAESDEIAAVAGDINRQSTDVVTWAPRTATALAPVINRFAVFVKSSSKWRAYVDREFEEDCIMDRVNEYMVSYVCASKGRIHEGGHITIHSANKERLRIMSLIFRFCPALRTNAEKQQEASRISAQFFKQLQEFIELPKIKKPKYYYGPDELRVLFQKLLAGCDVLDVALQHGVLWTMMMYLAARPGSLIVVQDYPNCYLKFKDIALYRSGQQFQFTTVVTITAWKGKRDQHTLAQDFTLLPVAQSSKLLHDLGLLIVALGLRRGAFRDHKDVVSLGSGRDVHLAWKEEFLERPFFARTHTRGLGLEYDHPLAYAGARTTFMETARAAGFAAENAHFMNFRRMTCTAWMAGIGEQATKSLMGHKQSSDAVHTSYSDLPARFNMTSVRLEGDLELIDVPVDERRAPALFRHSVAEVTPLPLEAAFAMSEELTVLFLQRESVKHALQTGSDLDVADFMDTLFPEDMVYWLSVAANASHPVALFHSHLSSRFRKLLGLLRTKYRNYMITQAIQHDAPPTLDQLEQRARENNQPTNIIALLRSMRGSFEEDDGTNRDRDQLPPISWDSALHDVGPGPASTACREEFVSALVEHVDDMRGPQTCKICVEERGDNRIWESRYKVLRHMQQTHKDCDITSLLPASKSCNTTYATTTRIQAALGIPKDDAAPLAPTVDANIPGSNATSPSTASWTPRASHPGHRYLRTPTAGLSHGLLQYVPYTSSNK